MPQTTDAIPRSCAMVQIASDCVTWTDISGSTQSMSDATQERMIGVAYTLDGDTAIGGAGKREPMVLKFTIVYTENDVEAYDLARAIFEAEGCEHQMCVRWSPGGGDAGDYMITTADGSILIGFEYPPVDAATAGPIMTTFTIWAPYVGTETLLT